MKMFFMSAVIAKAETSSSVSCAELTSSSAVPQCGLLPASDVCYCDGELVRLCTNQQLVLKVLCPPDFFHDQVIVSTK